MSGAMVPMARAARVAAVLAAVLAAAIPFVGVASAASLAAPSLALSLVGGDAEPELLLAQRAVDREWGPSEDSVYVTVDVPGWRTEAVALGLSAAIPGAGQAYVGSSRAWWYAIAEGAGWVARWLYLRRGHDLQDDAEAFAGTPADTTSRWSFQRWERATGGDAATLRLLYDRDRDAFYERIANDPSYLPGWSGDPSATRVAYSELRESSEDRLRYARYAGTGLWINHLVSAFDALREARIHDLSLGRDVRLRVGSGWGRSGPVLTAAVRREF